ncbi:NADP-dependent oxidoreductase domain-containing protein [Hygrophoropsis aurantiaca]|uniref:NADP-dependent oxidoreductase domain-containing protein n=1 Tax=Hygrophoropsis aurantiaca TaxID=72124 RepID=A0ACB8A6X4_9AGAM|nr:NADP-dependent oxidoreductase domain-containing protein [Hygrophoropsis aurantiaca]
MAARIPLIYGAASFGARGTHAARIHDLPECQKCVDYFVGKGYNVFDTSRIYGDGTSEEYLAQLDLKGAIVDSKSWPSALGDHSPEKLRASVEKSIQALAPYKIRVLFLHVPDRSVSYEETLRGVNELYKEGLFEEFGLSNYPAWEVAEFVGISKANNWVMPTVYEGIYNALERNAETELFPCLRKYGIRFHGFSPLSRGLFAGIDITSPSSGSRWDLKTSTMAAGLHARYQGFSAVFQQLRELLAQFNIAGSAVALRWLQHHSQLTPNDAVIIGASSLQQLQANVEDSEAGPLPEEVVKLLEEAWIDHKGRAPPYFS